MSTSFSRTTISIIFLGTLLSGCSGKEARIQSHLSKGNAYLAQSETDKALVEVRNVLQMDPRRPQAYYLAGQIEESRGEMRGAYADFSKAIEVKPDYFDAQAALARLNLAVGNDVESQKQVDQVLAKDPKNVQATAIAAALEARRGNVDGAIKMVSAEGDAAHLPPRTATVLAGLYVSKGEIAHAEPIVASALNDNPKDISLLMIDADLNHRLNQPDKAIADYQRATEAAPKDFRIWQAWAAFQDRAGHYDDAVQVLTKSIAAVPEDSTRRLALVGLITHHQGEEAGLKQLISMVDDRPRDYPVGFALAEYYTQKSQMGAARDVLNRIVHSDGHGLSGLKARNQLATLDLATGDVPRARADAEEILKIDPRDSSALLLRGRIELSDNQIDNAIADFRAAARDKPDSVQVLGLLARAYVSKKQPDLARDTVADAASLYPNRPEISLLQMQLLDSEGRTADAIAVSDEAIRRNPQNFELVRAKVTLEEKQKDFHGAEATLASWQTAHPSDAVATMVLGQAYALEKNVDSALAQFDHAQTLSPSSREPESAALQVLLAAKRYPDAEKRVDADIAKAPSQAVNYQLRGDVLSAKGDATGAETAYRHAIELQPTAVTAYLNLANFLATQKRADDVKATFESALKANPKNALLETAYSDYLTKTQQYDGAIALYNKMLTETPTNAVAANNLAFLLAQFKGDPQSLERAATLTKGFQYSTDASFLDTLGWTDYKLGHYGDAVAVYQRAALLAPDSPAVQLRYGMALYKSGAIVAGQDHLKLASKAGGKLPDDAQQMLASS